MHSEPIRLAAAHQPQRRARRPVAALAAVLAGGVVAVALPFLVLVRGATYLYSHRGLGGWTAIALALLLAACLLTAYAAWASWKLTRRVRLGTAFRWIAVPLVLLYGGYTLAYLSHGNAKSPEVRSHYRALHPVLRIAVGTLVLWDRDLVVTDMTRTPDDYADMGLSQPAASRHYRQADGYVHAVDLRTLGRPRWRTWLTGLYFRAMGFGTRRHRGTADHLHVSLPPR